MEKFHLHLNKQHQSIQLTMEKEGENGILFSMSTWRTRTEGSLRGSTERPPTQIGILTTLHTTTPASKQASSNALETERRTSVIESMQGWRTTWRKSSKRMDTHRVSYTRTYTDTRTHKLHKRLKKRGNWRSSFPMYNASQNTSRRIGVKAEFKSQGTLRGTLTNPPAWTNEEKCCVQGAMFGLWWSIYQWDWEKPTEDNRKQVCSETREYDEWHSCTWWNTNMR